MVREEEGGIARKGVIAPNPEEKEDSNRIQFGEIKTAGGECRGRSRSRRNVCLNRSFGLLRWQYCEIGRGHCYERSLRASWIPGRAIFFVAGPEGHPISRREMPGWNHYGTRRRE